MEIERFDVIDFTESTNIIKREVNNLVIYTRRYDKALHENKALDVQVNRELVQLTAMQIVRECNRIKTIKSETIGAESSYNIISNIFKNLEV